MELRQERCIWNALPARRRKYFERFIREYEAVRASEGRGSDDPAFYLALPHKDLTRRHRWQWKIRSRTYRYIERNILPELERRQGRPLFLLDLGAGNGWFSYRLTLRGHLSVAVDLLTNAFDGLGAASHYLAVLPALFPRFQAEADRLPFAGSQFDCVFFNASFHYSENYARTLKEAIRCLRPQGTIVIADSPWYSDEEFGQKMLQERHKDFQERFSFPSDGLASCEYLTDERLAALEERFDIDWKVYQPWYGVRWAMRPWVAKWKSRREPAQFRVYSSEVPSR
ncbi:MAG TPA: class I SAM-dependent methyltransferase [Candidatus Acidoferrum sp.]|nr:class I SAM-dependent methyltransferase [Candidatus Acidoferrum sp.]